MSERKRDTKKSGGLSVSGGIAGGADPGAASQEQMSHDSETRRED